jgi:hypothetical protein
MATAEFILQGFTASTHIDALQRLFDLPDFQRVLVSVAFVSEGDVERIEAHLIPHAACATVFTGIAEAGWSSRSMTVKYLWIEGRAADLWTCASPIATASRPN